MIKNNIYKIDKTADGLAKPYLQITFKMTLEEWTSDYNSRLVSENVKCLFLILTLDTQSVSSAGRERVKLMVKNFSSCTLMLCWWLPTLLSQPGVAYIVREKCNNDWAVRLWSPGELGLSCETVITRRARTVMMRQEWETLISEQPALVQQPVDNLGLWSPGELG